jgi:hypothetical protein
MKLIILTSVIFTALLIGYDINQRFFIEKNKTQSRGVTPKEQNTKLLPQITDKQKVQLTALYSIYQKTEEVPVEKIQGMSLAEQRNQKGQLTELFSGDWVYQLVAIITPEGSDSGKPFALLSAKNIKTQESKTEELVHGSMFIGYQVTIFDTKKIELEMSESTTTITLLMYNPIVNK